MLFTINKKKQQVFYLSSLYTDLSALVSAQVLLMVVLINSAKPILGNLFHLLEYQSSIRCQMLCRIAINRQTIFVL